MPTMPNVVGLSCQQATTALIQAGVTPDNGSVSGNYTNLGYFDTWPVSIIWAKSTQKAGTVTAQSPASGNTVAFGVSVTLTASSYPVSVSSMFSAGGSS